MSGGTRKQDLQSARGLLNTKPDVIHLGIAEVAEGAEAAGAKVAHVDFKPPAGGNRDRIKELARLTTGPAALRIRSADATQ